MHFRLFNLFFFGFFLRCLGWDKVMAPSIYSLSAIQLTQEMNASMFPTSKCTNFPSKKLKWFWGKKKKLRHFAVCTAISCLVSKEDLFLLWYFLWHFQVSQQLETQHQWRSQVWRRSLLVPNFFLPTQGSTHVSPCQRWANAMRNRSWSLNS